MQKFSSEQQYNECIEQVVCGPLTREEIGWLLARGYAFKPRTLNTEYSLAALEALARAPREHDGERILALGRLEALQAIAGRAEDLEWFEGFEEGASLACDATRARAGQQQ